jgi:hypothetical protein
LVQAPVHPGTNSPFFRFFIPFRRIANFTDNRLVDPIGAKYILCLKQLEDAEVHHT